jgi:hypothetical protein
MNVSRGDPGMEGTGLTSIWIAKQPLCGHCIANAHNSYFSVIVSMAKSASSDGKTVNVVHW